jgi:hypothetical protein
MPDHETHDMLPAMKIRDVELSSSSDSDWLAAAQIRNAREYVDIDALENACWLDAAAMGGAP